MLRWTVHLKGQRRAYHAAVAVKHKVYTFGGYCHRKSYTYMDQIDVHVFNSVSLRWTTLPPVINEIGEPALEVASTRMCHTAVLVEDTVYVWGGIVDFKIVEDANWVTISGNNCNVLYEFDVATRRWFKPKVSGTIPGGRAAHSACVLGDVMYIFGGYSMMTGYTNDIFKLKSMVWSLINTRGTRTQLSACHSATIIGKKMFVFGGRGNQDEINYNSIRVFDTETNCWLSMPPMNLLPERRRGHSAFAYNGELYIFGGANFPKRCSFNDLWKFNPETFSWKELHPKGEGPFLIARMCCWMCMVEDRIIFFGGYRYTPSELFILDLSPSLRTLCKLGVIQYSLKQSGLPHDIRWELAAMMSRRKRTKRKIDDREVPSKRNRRNGKSGPFPNSLPL